MSVTTLPNVNNSVSLKGMVDLALGTPEVGSVNFNMLHTVLHALISKLDMDGVIVTSSTEQPKPESSEHPSQTISLTTTPYHLLQDRIKIIEKQISDLNSLPSNKEVLDGIFGIEKAPMTNPDNKRMVSDLWQTLSMRKKVNSNEEGIDRLSSLIDTILDQMTKLRSDNEAMKKRLEDVEALKGVNDKVNGLQNDLTNLMAEFNKMKQTLSEYPSPDFFKNVVTWEGLEKALRGIRDEMDELKKPTERIVVNMATEPMSRPTSEMSNGPSKACAEMLENLGALTDAHDALDKRVVVLEEEMPNKADKKDLENLKFPDDLLKTINQLKSQVESLMSSKNRDSEALARIRDILNALQDKMKAVNITVDKLSNENKDFLKQLEDLFGITRDHESRKADIGYVDGLLRTKADKSLLDTKVNFSLFDETTGNLHNLIDDVLRKLLAAEEELRNLLKSMASDLNCKVDRDDLTALKEWIEKRLRNLADKFKNLRGYDAQDDDAAGLRKQLLQHFHCISCDRPVDMAPQGISYANGLPNPKGMPSTKSLRPYTTYELDLIRQQAKGNKNIYVQDHTKRYGSDIVDVYQTPRPCGGSHTTTYSHKKMVRLGNLNMSNCEEEVAPRGNKEELDLQGTDGHMYRGRVDRSQTTLANNNVYSEPNNLDRLPPVPLSQRSQTVMTNNNLTPRGAFVTSRPKSAVKLTPRPATSGGSSNYRPESARLPAQEPDSRPASPNQRNSPLFQNDIEQEVVDVDETVITSENIEVEMVDTENNGLVNDETVLS